MLVILVDLLSVMELKSPYYILSLILVIYNFHFISITRTIVKNNSPCFWTDYQDPYAVVVLLQNDLVVIDLLTPGFPCFENPYPMDIHESPVTCCAYFADCPSDLVPAFYSVGSKSQKKTGFSEKDWPISGGEWSSSSSGYNEIILTG